MDDDATDAELTRLADGSLPDARVAELCADVRRSPDRQARLDAQQRAILLTRSTEEILAPPALQAAIREQIAARQTPRRSRARPRISLPRVFIPLGAGAVAAIVLVVVFVATGGQALTVSRTAQAALAPPTQSTPSVDSQDVNLLSRRVGSVAFPAYERRPDWRASGARSDRIDDRRVQTVFYDIGGRRVGYSIVAGAPLDVPAGHAHLIDGVRYVTTQIGKARLVTWRLGGHTCVIAGRRVSERLLLKLAATKPE